MECLLRISEAASLGVHALVQLALQNDPRPLSVSHLAGSMMVSEAHLSKVLQRLARQGFVTSRRGPRGGFVLAREAHQISLMEVYAAIDGPLSICACLLGRDQCHPGACIMGDVLSDVNRLVANHLDNTTLQDIVEAREKVALVESP